MPSMIHCWTVTYSGLAVLAKRWGLKLVMVVNGQIDVFPTGHARSRLFPTGDGVVTPVEMIEDRLCAAVPSRKSGEPRPPLVWQPVQEPFGFVVQMSTTGSD